MERVKKLIERCDKCDLKQCENCEISWSEVQALKNLLKAYKEDEAVIEEMAKYLAENDVTEIFCENKVFKEQIDCELTNKKCEDCIKEYFRNKAREEK